MLVHNSGACGSPRVAGSTSSRRSSSNVASPDVSFFRPPPARRTRPAARSDAALRNSASPRPIVLRAIPVMRDSADTPPPACRPRFGRRKPTPTTLVQNRLDTWQRMSRSDPLVCSGTSGLSRKVSSSALLTCSPQQTIESDEAGAAAKDAIEAGTHLCGVGRSAQ